MKLPSSCHILLGDDNEVIHQVVKEAAEARGHKVTSAKTGAGTLARAIETQPDLIVLDIMFPDVDGRDVLGELKAEEKTAHIPVVMWSARPGRDADRRIVLELGAEDYVEKNEAEHLIAKLDRVLLRLAETRDRSSAR
ncbi:MAG TPA: response regulator [Polyangiaceae bacterium]|jgi:DNA-binding response OmpR family regulator|nr:response regulator [Polyangiaceae bacterium]